MSMLERVLLLAAIAVTSVPAVACDTSEAAPLLPAPVGRDAGPDAKPRPRPRPPVDAGVDAPIVDAAVTDAMPIDAGVVDAAIDAAIDAGVDAPIVDAAMGDAIVDAPRPIDGNILFDSQEAPPLYDARILSR